MKQLLQAIAAFVYCNRHSPGADCKRHQAAGGRRKTEISRRQQAPVQLNALWTPPIL